MKTTVEIPDSLYWKARDVAEGRGQTFRAVLEVALRSYLDAEDKTREPFRLALHTFRGEGLQPGLREGDWSAIHALAYEGHGA